MFRFNFLHQILARVYQFIGLALGNDSRDKWVNVLCTSKKFASMTD